MHVEFEQSQDTIAAFASDYVARSVVVQKQIFRIRMFFGLVFLPWGLAYFWIGRPYDGIILSLLPVALIVFWPRFITRLTRRNLIRQLEIGKNPPWKSPAACRLELDSGKLVISKAHAETRIVPSALESLHETATHVFVYTSPNTGFAIPRSCVRSGDLNRFVTQLREEMAAA